MQAIVLKQIKTPLATENRPDLEPAEGQVVVRLKAASLNRRDYWITQGMYPGVKTPVILGSDGAGVVSKIGDGVAHHWAEQEVIINPGWNWGPDARFQSNEFRILGMPDDGAFAEEVLAPAEHLYAKPAHLDWRQAAALPLSGVTAFRALFTQGGCGPGTRVLVSGVGGGVATFALQFALAAGAVVFVTSSSPEKIRRAIEMGASAGFDYRAAGWSKQLLADHGAIDLIIDSAGGRGYGDLLNVAAAGGRIVNYGATAGPTEQVDLFKLFWKQLHLVGSTMGSPDDFKAMLDLVNQKSITPIIDCTLPLRKANEALGRMESSPQFGKMVLDI